MARSGASVQRRTKAPGAEKYRYPDTEGGGNLPFSLSDLERVQGSPTLHGNNVTLHASGPEAFDAWLAAISDARQFVYLQNYLIRADAVGHRFRELLSAKALEGIPVFVVHDWLGGWATPRRFWRPLTATGAKVHCFNAPSLGLGNPFGILQRDHRKLVVVDGEIGFVGGFCIGDEWAGSGERDPWRDTGVAVRGPLVGAAQRAFESHWGVSTGERIANGQTVRAGGRGLLEDHPVGSAPPADTPQVDPSRPVNHLGTGGPAGELAPALRPSPGDAPAWLIEGEPGRARIYRALHLAAARARARIWITDAYFVAPRSVSEALGAAARHGVDVRVLVPAHSNWPIVASLSRGGYRPLLESGIRIFEWRGPMIHAKTSVVDGVWCRVGSSNLNSASLLSNWELDVSVLDTRLAGEMEDLFLADLAEADEIVLPRRRLTSGSAAGPTRLGLDSNGSKDAEPPRDGTRPLEPSGRLRERFERETRDRGAVRGQLTLASAVRAGTALGGALSGNRVLGREDRTVLGTASVGIFLIALLAAIFPEVAGWILAAAAGWFGLTISVRAYVQSRRAQGEEAYTEPGSDARAGGRDPAARGPSEARLGEGESQTH